jgi:RimJ/RimL family protein N-acetyltransferase
VPFPERVETRRLVLRRFAERDLDAFAAVWLDPPVRAALDPTGSTEPEQAPARFQRLLDHWDEHGFGLWAAKERASGELAGWIGPSRPAFVPELAHEVEIGWTLRSSSWGRGLATEGAAAAVEAAFAHLESERLVSLITPDNRRSIAVAVRLGMRKDGRVRHGDLGVELCVYALAAGERRPLSDESGGGPAAGPGSG